jgi:hypothetical protein
MNPANIPKKTGRPGIRLVSATRCGMDAPIQYHYTFGPTDAAVRALATLSF